MPLLETKKKTPALPGVYEKTINGRVVRQLVEGEAKVDNPVASALRNDGWKRVDTVEVKPTTTTVVPTTTTTTVKPTTTTTTTTK